MSLNVRDIKNIMDVYAPEKLKESYDNVGLMVGDLNAEVNSVLIALDCTLKVIEEAKTKQCNLIITHHPILFKKPSSITKQTLIGKKIMELIKNDINVYASHTNLDSVKNGLNDLLMKLLNFDEYKTIELSPSSDEGDKVSGIGRIGKLNESMTLAELCTKVKNSLEISSLRYVGEEDTIIKKVAVVNGSGEDYFYAAKRLGADCIITGDTTYHYVSDFNEEGMCIIDAGHFETEWPVFKIFSKELQNKINNLGFNTTVIISDSLKSPYKYK